jgi:hypothetical protein
MLDAKPIQEYSVITRGEPSNSVLARVRVPIGRSYWPVLSRVTLFAFATYNPDSGQNQARGRPAR